MRIMYTVSVCLKLTAATILSEQKRQHTFSFFCARILKSMFGDTMINSQQMVYNRTRNSNRTGNSKRTVFYSVGPDGLKPFYYNKYSYAMKYFKHTTFIDNVHKS